MPQINKLMLQINQPFISLNGNENEFLRKLSENRFELCWAIPVDSADFEDLWNQQVIWVILQIKY
jgi:hypothetical protein